MNRIPLVLLCLGILLPGKVLYAMSPGNITSNCTQNTFEFHFQEIFSGERIDILTGGNVRAHVVATTRFQTGLAQIEKITLCDQEEVTLLIKELNLEASLRVDITKPFVTVNMRNGQFQVDKTSTRPGYL